VSNTRIWEALGKTDPKETKPFSRAGGFKGTAIKPMWLNKRMTEQFGPCGTGWGFGQPEFTTMPVNNEILGNCTVNLWYVENGERKDVWGVGGDKVLAVFSSGPKADDEAFKKSFTDALGNAMKFLGAAADIHMGMFDDSKYVQQVAKEFAEEARGTKEAAQEVAKRKIAEMKSQADVPDQPNRASGSKFKEMLDSFGEIKEQLKQAGLEQEYYTVLEFYGVKHANEFKDFAAARECYKALVRGVSKLKGEEKLVNA
jgi:hypothetical protein